MARTNALAVALAVAFGCGGRAAPIVEPPAAVEPLPTPAEHDQLVRIAALEVTIIHGLADIARSDADLKTEALAAIAPRVTELVAAADQLADRTTAPACEAGVAAASHAVDRDFHALLGGDPADGAAPAMSLEHSLDDLAAHRRACGVADPADYPQHPVRAGGATAASRPSPPG